MEYVRETIRISASIGRVWATVSAFGAMEPWCPAIKAMELEGHGIGSIRIAHLAGIVSREQLLAIDADKYRMTYSIIEPSPLPLHNIRATMQLSSPEPNVTDILWFSIADEASAEIKTAVGAMVSGFYRENLVTLKAMLEKERIVRSLM